MIIAHHQKFIFIPIQKTGSTSVREVLADKYNCVVASSDNSSLIYNHTSACRLKLYFEEQKQFPFSEQNSWNWKDYFKFTFVRNPYARLVSQYNYFCKIGSNPQEIIDSIFAILVKINATFMSLSQFTFFFAKYTRRKQAIPSAKLRILMQLFTIRS